MKKIYLFILLILISTGVCFAQGTQRKLFFPEPQLGGLNTSVSPLILDAKYLTRATNVLYDHIGSRQKRGGILYLNETSAAPLESSGSNTIMGMFDFKKISTTGVETRVLVCHSDGKIYKMDDFDGSWDSISLGPFTVDIPVDYAVLRQAATTVDTLIMANGEETPQTWNQDSTGTSDLGDAPVAGFYPAYIESHRSRLFAAGVPSYPYRVYYSAAYKYNDWTTVDDAGYLDVIDRLGSKVTGLHGGFFGYLIIFTEESAYQLAGSSITDFVLTPLFNIGTISNASVVQVGNDLYFVSSKGIHSLQTTDKYGDVEATYLSAPIQTDFNALNKNRLKYCCGEAFEELNYIIWSFTGTGQTYNNICFVYDYIGDRWSTWDGINASSLVVSYNNSGKRELLAGNYDGFVNRLNRITYADNGEAYTMTWSTPFLNFGDPILDKSFEELFMFIRPQGESTLDVISKIENQASESLEFSQQGTSAVLGSFVLGVDRLGAGALVPRSQSLTGQGKTLQLEVSQDDVNVSSEVYGFGVEFIPADVDYF